MLRHIFQWFEPWLGRERIQWTRLSSWFSQKLRIDPTLMSPASDLRIDYSKYKYHCLFPPQWGNINWLLPKIVVRLSPTHIIPFFLESDLIRLKSPPIIDREGEIKVPVWTIDLRNWWAMKWTLFVTKSFLSFCLIFPLFLYKTLLILYLIRVAKVWYMSH